MNSHHVYSDPLAVIYNEGQWHLNRVTPLSNLHYSAIRLKEYATKIRQALVRVATRTTVQYSVSFEDLPKLVYRDGDPSSLMINVSLNIENSSKNKIIYTAILLSWGVSLDLSNIIHLPYMIERGEEKIGVQVKKTMELLFDCIITCYKFTQKHMQLFFFAFVDIDSSRSTDSMILQCNTKVKDKMYPKLKDKFSLRFDVGDIHMIWNDIKNKTNEDESIQAAYKFLQGFINDTAHININSFEIKEILLPKAGVKSNGVVKMKTPEVVNTVFEILNVITTFKDFLADNQLVRGTQLNSVSI